MASYDELRTLFGDDSIRKRVEVAAVIAAEAAIDASPGTASERALALAVLRDPETWGRTIFRSVLAANSGNTASQIQSASDTAIQSNVDAVFASLANANAGA